MLKALYRIGSWCIDPFCDAKLFFRASKPIWIFLTFRFQSFSNICFRAVQWFGWKRILTIVVQVEWNETKWRKIVRNFFFANDDCRRKSVGLTQKGHSFFTCCRFESWWLLPQCSLVAKLCNCCGSGGWAVNCWSQWPGFKSCSSRAP